jgi:hypothetical protein
MSFVLFIAAAAALCAIELWIISSPAFSKNLSILALAVTVDIVAGIPLLFYIFVVRPSRLPALTLIPVFLLSVVLANKLLPPEGHTYLAVVEVLLPIAEVVALSYAFLRLRAIYREYRRARAQERYFIDALETGARRVLGNLPAVNLLTTEFSLLFLAVGGWFMRFETRHPGDRVFTTYKQSLYPIIVPALLLLSIPETLLLHALVSRWSPTAAVVITILSIYTVVWLIGDFNATRLHPIVLATDTLYLRAGLRWRADIPIADIAGIHKIGPDDAKPADYVNFAFAGEPQLMITLKRRTQVRGLFGIKKDVSHIGLFLDDVATFRHAVEEAVINAQRGELA